MKLLDLITDFHNWLTDKDFLWWPFSFLRPEPNEFMTFKLTLIMTGCFGGLATLLFTVLAIMNNAFNPYQAFVTCTSCFVFFIGWFNLITKPFWNRRARALNA